MTESLLKERVHWVIAGKKKKTRSWGMKLKPPSAVPGGNAKSPQPSIGDPMPLYTSSGGEKDVSCFERMYIGCQ